MLQADLGKLTVPTVRRCHSLQGSKVPDDLDALSRLLAHSSEIDVA